MYFIGDSSCAPGSLFVAHFRLMWERLAKHREAALGLFPSCLILNHIPMLDQDPILDPDDVCCDPVHGRPKLRKTPMDDHEIALSDNYAWLIP